MSDVVHLWQSSECYSICCGGIGGDDTSDVGRVTCIRCLELAQADAEERAARCIERKIELGEPSEAERAGERRERSMR